MPMSFDSTGSVEEYWTCRNNATLQDMSSLLKFDVVGPDAEELLQHCCAVINLQGQQQRLAVQRDADNQQRVDKHTAQEQQWGSLQDGGYHSSSRVFFQSVVCHVLFSVK